MTVDEVREATRKVNEAIEKNVFVVGKDLYTEDK